MKTMLERVKELVEYGDNIEYIIAFLSGWTETDAQQEPEKTYTAVEMKDLFDLLYDVSKRNICKN